MFRDAADVTPLTLRLFFTLLFAMMFIIFFAAFDADDDLMPRHYCHLPLYAAFFFHMPIDFDILFRSLMLLLPLLFFLRHLISLLRCRLFLFIFQPLPFDYLRLIFSLSMLFMMPRLPDAVFCHLRFSLRRVSLMSLISSPLYAILLPPPLMMLDIFAIITPILRDGFFFFACFAFTLATPPAPCFAMILMLL